MTTRDPAVKDFLGSVRNALATRDIGPAASASIDRIYQALDEVGRPGSGRTQSLPVCAFLPAALERARRSSQPIAVVADALTKIEPQLYWAPRNASGPQASSNWPDHHANAMIVGPGGIESRNDLQIGVSLLAPHVRYPDHNHGPEEVYLVLSPGRFQHGESDWFEPGIGGTLYNEPNMRHAMASDGAPLLAVWCLWVGHGH